MSTIDRSSVIGTFNNRAQAQQAVAELGQAGFGDNLIGLAGQTEVAEKMGTDITPRVEQGQPDVVVVTVKAGERWKQALDTLLKNGAFDTVPSPTEAFESSPSQFSTAQMKQTEAAESVIEYDPIAGPRVVTENRAPVASGGYGLQRDPALDTDTSVGSPYVDTNEVAQEEGHDTLFGQTVEPPDVEPGSPEDPNVQNPRIV